MPASPLESHFLDGNDPARLPGARICFPDANIKLRYEPDTRTMFDPDTGYRFFLDIADREYRSFSARIEHHSHPIVGVEGYFGAYDKAGFGKTRAYSLSHARLIQEGASEAQLKPLLLAVSSFLNHYPDTLGRPEYAGNVVVICNIPPSTE